MTGKADTYADERLLEAPFRGYLRGSAWDSTEPASSLVASAYLSLPRTVDARVAISLLVSLPFCDCESAEAARLLAVSEDLGSRSTSEASELIGCVVTFLFIGVSI
jgi:hypothetical protein